MSDGLDTYNAFDNWAKRTGILDGGGLTWVARIPLNLVIVAVSLVVWLITKSIKKEVNNANKQR